NVASAASHHFFAFSSCRQLICLHSFPTRRSSDLSDPNRRISERDIGRIIPEPVRPAAPPPPAPVAAPPPPPSNKVNVSIIRNGEDRKSTRLHSSHGSISDDFFCSKKKKHARPH